MGIRLSGLVSGMDTESLVKELMSAQSLKKTKIESKITKLEWKQEKWKELNTKIYALYTGNLSKIKTQGSYLAKTATSSNEEVATVTAKNTAVAGSHSIEVKSLASAQYITGGKTASDVTLETKLVDVKTLQGSVAVNATEGTEDTDAIIEDPITTITITSGSNKVDFEMKKDSTVNDFLKACTKAGLNASYDTTQDRFFISSKESGTANAFTITDGADGKVLANLGLGNITYDKSTKDVTVTPSNNDIYAVKPSDCTVVYNNALLTSSTNTITVNGLTITAKAESTSPVNITVSKDTQKVYDMVKNFVKSYNELIKEMNELYNASSAKGYDVLTEEEEEAMTDDQVEKWNDKIKDSLLRRDTTLGGLVDSMKSSLQKSVKVNEKSYSLSTFGIGTTDYTEKGLLHIYGDADDSAVSDKDNKLMKALEEDPDTVMEALSGITSGLYKTMTEKMKSSTLSSALTYYNDKEMDKTMIRYKEELTKMETRLQTLESRYFKQFTAMETAMAKLNSQSSYISQLTGGSSQ